MPTVTPPSYQSSLWKTWTPTLLSRFNWNGLNCLHLSHANTSPSMKPSAWRFHSPVRMSPASTAFSLGHLNVRKNKHGHSLHWYLSISGSFAHELQVATLNAVQCFEGSWCYLGSSQLPSPSHIECFQMLVIFGLLLGSDPANLSNSALVVMITGHFYQPPGKSGIVFD